MTVYVPHDHVDCMLILHFKQGAICLYCKHNLGRGQEFNKGVDVAVGERRENRSQLVNANSNQSGVAVAGAVVSLNTCRVQ